MPSDFQNPFLDTCHRPRYAYGTLPNVTECLMLMIGQQHPWVSSMAAQQHSIGCTHAGEEQQLGASLEAAVAAAEGSVVALMSSTGAWATGILVSAAHGYILTVAHLLSERGQHPAQQPGQHSQPMSAQPSQAAHCHSRDCIYHATLHKKADSIIHASESCTEGIAQHHCSTAHPHKWRRGDVLVQIPAPEHSFRARNGNDPEGQSQHSRTPEETTQPLWSSASLVYCFSGPLDVALLQLDDPSLSRQLHDLVLRPAGGDALRQGERVAVMGFPLLSPRLGFGSCATAGIIAKVTTAQPHTSSLQGYGLCTPFSVGPAQPSVACKGKRSGHSSRQRMTSAGCRL